MTRRDFFRALLAVPFVKRLFKWLPKPHPLPSLADNFFTRSPFIGYSGYLRDHLVPEWDGTIYPTYGKYRSDLLVTDRAGYHYWSNVLAPHEVGTVLRGTDPRIWSGRYEYAGFDSSGSFSHPLLHRIELVTRPSRLQLYYARLSRMDEVVEIEMVRDATVKLDARHRVDRELQTAIGVVERWRPAGHLGIPDRATPFLNIEPTGYGMPSDLDLERALKLGRFEPRGNVAVMQMRHLDRFACDLGAHAVHAESNFVFGEGDPFGQEDVLYGVMGYRRDFPRFEEFTDFDFRFKVERDRCIYSAPEQKT